MTNIPRWQQVAACLILLVLTDTAPAASPRGATSGITAAWLVGRWGPAEPGSLTKRDCDTDGVVAFDSKGQFGDGGSTGHYRTDGTHIIYYDRIKYDEGENTEDRSGYHHPLITHVTRLSPRAFRENGDVFVRCPKL